MSIYLNICLHNKRKSSIFTHLNGYLLIHRSKKEIFRKSILNLITFHSWKNIWYEYVCGHPLRLCARRSASNLLGMWSVLQMEFKQHEQYYFAPNFRVLISKLKRKYFYFDRHLLLLDRWKVSFYYSIHLRNYLSIFG